jgi:outer membrane protein OmpA-like peptidoglycan-associated protein
LANAQRYDDGRFLDDGLAPLYDELDRLRSDDLIARFASDELAQAEDYIERLDDGPRGAHPGEIDKAERLLERVERVAQRRASNGRGRQVVIVEDDDDDQAWDAARNAQDDAARAQAEANEARERALAARLEAENERNENARLRQELGEAQTRVTDRGIVLTLGDVLFAVGKADLKPGAARTLDKLVNAMRRDQETTVTIEGHTDSTGKHDYNVNLSNRRANAVRSYLASKGVASQRIIARGLGPDFPVATNATEAGRQQNRRVEVLVQNDLDE